MSKSRDGLYKGKYDPYSYSAGYNRGYTKAQSKKSIEEIKRKAVQAFGEKLLKQLTSLNQQVHGLRQCKSCPSVEILEAELTAIQEAMQSSSPDGSALKRTEEQ